MKNNIQTNTFLAASLCSIVIAFILWYSFAYREYSLNKEYTNSAIDYVDITTSTRNITIKNAPENIRFRVNKEIIHTGSINLK